MEDKVILKLVDAALSGDKNLVQMAVRQLASKVRDKNDFLSKQLSDRLHFSALREAGVKSKPLPVDAESRQNLVRVENPVLLDKSPVYSAHVGDVLNQIVLEREYSDELLSEGVYPTRSVIFQGPPGVGKTMSARWLAKSLGLPLFTLDLATVMSSFLGKTGSNVRSVLEHAMAIPCVLLLDEFDAIAKRRDDDRELGELKRLVNVLLQAIDDWPSTSLLVAATNHGELLDPAIWRRFDVEIFFSMPSIDVITEYLVEYWPDALESGRAAKHFVGMSFSDIDRTLRQAKREKIISSFNFKSEKEGLNTQGVTSVKRPLFSTKDQRNKTIIKLFKEGKSQRTISSTLGVSRPTIKKVLEENLHL